MTLYDAVRTAVAARLKRILPSATDAELENLSLGGMLNLLFLLRGEWGSLGDYVRTTSALEALLGEGMVWHVPEKENTKEEAQKPVQ
jgi:hypothetical protein